MNIHFSSILYLGTFSASPFLIDQKEIFRTFVWLYIFLRIKKSGNWKEPVSKFVRGRQPVGAKKLYISSHSSEEAKAELGMMWQLVPQNRHYYFYSLSIPQSAWYVPGTPATMVGVATTIQNASDGKHLVEDVIYRSATDAPILLATTPMQLTSITTDLAEQSITFTWKPKIFRM